MNLTSQDIIPLTAEEQDCVSGGAKSMNAVFKYGDLVIEIYADASGYSVATTNTTTGKSSARTYYHTD